MQIIVNTCIQQPDGIVMIEKPRRGWWYLPGGKVDPTETWMEAALREVREETGLCADGLRLSGIHLITTRLADGSLRDERVIVQFAADRVTGVQLAACKEGPVSCVRPEGLALLPMNEGDRQMLLHTLRMPQDGSVVFGKFLYDESENLLEWHFQTGTDEARSPLPGR